MSHQNFRLYNWDLRSKILDLSAFEDIADILQKDLHPTKKWNGNFVRKSLNHKQIENLSDTQTFQIRQFGDFVWQVFQKIFIQLFKCE